MNFLPPIPILNKSSILPPIKTSHSLRLPVVYCVETRNRIRCSVAAYAYEIMDDPIISDGDFDRLAYSIKPHVRTGNAGLDLFFAVVFQPHTGQWVRSHPDLAGLHRAYRIHRPRR